MEAKKTLDRSRVEMRTEEGEVALVEAHEVPLRLSMGCTLPEAALPSEASAEPEPKPSAKRGARQKPEEGTSA